MKNISEGMNVIVKKKAFTTGSLSFIDYVPGNRNARIHSYTENAVGVYLDFIDEIWFVGYNEIRPVKQKEVSKFEPRFFMYSDAADVFVVQMNSSHGDEFSGVVIGVLKGSYYSVGYQADDWSFEEFTEVKRSVIYEPV